MAIMPTIAIAEDEDDLREAVAEYLSDRGFTVLTAADGPAFRTLLAAHHIDLAILDIAMPGEDGLSLARWLRSQSRMGIIFATAADQPVDRIIGLELGGDDYITKPYELRELLARVRSVLRRVGDAVAAPPPAQPATRPATIRVGSMTLEPAARRLMRADGSQVGLTSGEFDLLLALAERPNRPVSRQTLAELLHERGGEGGRAIDIRVVRLRRKLEDDPQAQRCLRTIRGEGYMFVPIDR